MELFNYVVKTVLFKPTELVEQNKGEFISWGER